MTTPVAFASDLATHPPSMPAGEIARIHAAHTTGIQWGMVFVMISAALYLP